MSGRTPLSPRTPLPNPSRRRSAFSPSFTSSPGCSSTPSTSNGCGSSTSPARRVLWSKGSPAQSSKSLSSPIAKQSFHIHEARSRRHSQSFSKENDSEKSSTFSKNASSTDPSWSVKTFSSTESNGTVTVELDFPHGGWDENEESSNESSTCSLEIVESEVECHPSPIHRGRKRKQSEVSEEDNAILSGMGEEIERQLEAKAERNRLTVPNVKNILRSVITNPYVQAMVRRSIKSGDIAVLGDIDVSFEPRMTRAKAKLLCDDASKSDLSWAGTPHKSQVPSECQALISEELNDDSEDDEEYQPGEDEHSDNDYSERDGSDRGSERDMSIEQQSPAFCDTDSESRPASPSPSPKPHITDSATQTNWSEDGVFKVPLLPPEPQLEEENIALRTRSKLPLNDTPLEEIEQAFIPPDITPDLYNVTCDNEDWQEFLKEFMQPMRSEPEVQNPDDEDDPEYNVLADEEIIDKEELRKDRAVRVSKRELNELMRELLEFTETLSSDDEEKKAESGDKDPTQLGICSSNNILSGNEDVSLFLDTYMSLGSITPMSALKTTPPTRSPSTPTLNTPVPPMSPPGLRTPDTGKKVFPNEVNSESAQNGFLNQSREERCYSLPSKGKPGSSGKKQNTGLGNGKLSSFAKPSCSNHSEKEQNASSSSCCLNSASTSQCVERERYTPGKPDNYPENQFIKTSKMSCTPGKLDNFPNSIGGVEDGQFMFFTPGKLDQYIGEFTNNEENNFDSIGMIGSNTPVRAVENNNEQVFSPGKQYFEMSSSSQWQDDSADFSSPILENQKTVKNWVVTDSQSERCDALSVQVDETALAEDSDSDPDVSVSLALSSEPPSPRETDSDFKYKGDAFLSSEGDVVIDGQVVLSSVQRLVLDQQMRQHVQLMTQTFLQTFQHPVHSRHAPSLKQKLDYLNAMGEKRKKSAFKPANLAPSLDLVNCWEQKLSSDEGSEVIQFMKDQVARATRLKERRQKTSLKFSPELLNLMAESKSFVYPQLLPHSPFKIYEIKKPEILHSEEQLMALGLEEFTEYIKQNNPQTKTCIQKALHYTSEYLVVSREGKTMWNYYRRLKGADESQPLKHYALYKCAPPTSHVVIPFNENKMVPLKSQPHYILPELWRNFVYPSSQ
ncbi:hypothetical protein FOCC_FOCC001246 [Frankliniella occidentalis]|uniref:Uncharacterized protein LOC113206652 n=1 Tax=Frankliniella occidentalis TaxID=133901 RepID=A0A6J1SBP2_FRAOC|nr:uncharacterized protein LOC113206652 [Frankliniella occidentalis]XP_026278609.1 uncharacterized protein LOC113206652 [Frankliniella occidentalis]KAE8752084.1 hypothetical protein FOCC_FOCC001246 [Frankliniella occidentalis]